MMVAMMLPAASPMIMTFASISARNGRSPVPRTAMFVTAYLGVWTIASAAGAFAQSGISAAATHMSARYSPLLLAGALLVAGIWQLTPLKHACLHRCRTPLGYLIAEWRQGARGAAIMGARHGTDCVVCCWALMAVMLALGTMDIGVMADGSCCDWDDGAKRCLCG
jgi:predicted metal-binding membrane protein